MRRDDDAAVRARRVWTDLIEEERGGFLPQILLRPAHGRQRHAQHVAVRDVAGADDGDVVRHAKAGIPDGLHRANRRGIVRGEHRVDARAQRQELPHRLIPVGLHEPAAGDPPRIGLDPGRPQRLAVRRLPAPRVHDRGTGDVRDGAPALSQQVRRGEAADQLVVGEHAMAGEPGVIVAIDHHQRGPERGHRHEGVAVPGRRSRGDHNPVHLPRAEQIQLAPLLARVLAGAAQQQPVAACADDRVDPGDDLHEERVHQVRDDDAERVRAPQREAAGDRVGPVAELLDARHHPRAGRVADVGLAVDDLGDGRDRHAQIGGDPFHGSRGHIYLFLAGLKPCATTERPISRDVSAALVPTHPLRRADRLPRRSSG